MASLTRASAMEIYFIQIFMELEWCSHVNVIKSYHCCVLLFGSALIALESALIAFDSVFVLNKFSTFLLTDKFKKNSMISFAIEDDFNDLNSCFEFSAIQWYSNFFAHNAVGETQPFCCIPAHVQMFFPVTSTMTCKNNLSQMFPCWQVF